MSIATFATASFRVDNHPYCKHLIIPTNAGEQSDLVSGFKWTPPRTDYDTNIDACLIADLEGDVLGVKRPVPTALTSGSLSMIPATSDFIIFGIGRTIAGTGGTDTLDGFPNGSPVEMLRVAAGNFTSGLPSIGASNVGDLHAGYIGDVGAQFTDSGAVQVIGSVGDDVAIYSSFVRGGNATTKIIKQDGNTLQSQQTPFENILNVPMGDACTLTNYMHANGAKFYMLGIFVFDNGLPTDIDTGMLWQIANCTTNAPMNRSLYPAWEGLE